MIDTIITRLETEIPEFDSRVQGAADFMALKKNRRLPQQTPAAYVLPMGLRAGQATASSGIFTQDITETVTVILFIRDNTTKGERVLKRLRPFVFQVINAVAGWAPSDEIGVFEMMRGVVLSNEDGCLIYQLDFSILDQLRIEE